MYSMRYLYYRIVSFFSSKRYVDHLQLSRVYREIHHLQKNQIHIMSALNELATSVSNLQSVVDEVVEKLNAPPVNDSDEQVQLATIAINDVVEKLNTALGKPVVVEPAPVEPAPVVE